MSGLLQIAQTASARLLVSSLADAGLREVVVSPGSRSTPIVAALEREPRLAIHDIIDERSAAYFALGRARATGRPALLVTTSGTAGAHAYPAVLEAEASFLPMLVLTADRPLELQGCGALQTIDQRDLFGRHVRGTFELALSEGAPASLRALRRTAAQAFAASLDPAPGPVHLNVKAKKPLEPAEPDDDAGRALYDEARRLLDAPVVRFLAPERSPPRALVEELAARIIEEERGLIVAGPMPPGLDRDAVLQLAERARYPLLAEATSQLGFADLGGRDVARVSGFDAAIRARAFREAAMPGLILQLGSFPTSGAYEAFALSEPRAFRVAIAPHGLPDPSSAAQVVASVDPGALARAVVSVLEARGFARKKGHFCEMWARAGGVVQAAARAEVERDAGLTEAGVTHAVVAAMPKGAMLAVGNGLPIRNLDLFAPAHGAVDVVAQRGTSGIDGLISSASALAAGQGGPPIALFIGDVTALHDLGGLAAARHARAPLAIVVLHNGGGRIFEQLPIARGLVGAETLRRFLTPHDTAFDHAARAFSVPHVAPGTRPELAAALASALGRPGATLIEAKVPPHDGRDAYERMFAAVEQALGGEESD